MTETTEVWNTKEYQTIKGVEIVDKEILITFEDGEIIIVTRDQLIARDTNNAHWDQVFTDGYVIILPTPSGEYEIPWTKIRLLSDSSFATHWATKEEEQAKGIGQQLRKLRRSRNLTAKEVARRAGISPQSLSRIETGKHDVVFTTLRKILGAMGYSLKDLAEVAANAEDSLSFRGYINGLQNGGLKEEWILERLIPRSILERLREADAGEIKPLLEEANEIIKKVFGWELSQIIEGSELHTTSKAIAGMFRPQGRTVEAQASAYAVLAHYLALLTTSVCDELDQVILPESPKALRYGVLEQYGDISFESMVKYVWSLGIPILPLRDSGAFHGACWKIDNRPIIVLKQMTPYQGRWFFDLVHELGHVCMHLSDGEPEILELEEISPFSSITSAEVEASNFAIDVLLFGRAEELAEISVEYADGKLEFLKSAVIRVSASEHVAVDILANYLAFRLNTQGENWWGAANNLQITDPSPWTIARKEFMDRVDLSKISGADRQLILRVLS